MPSRQNLPSVHKDPRDQDLDDQKDGLIAHFEGERARLVTQFEGKLADVEHKKEAALKKLHELIDEFGKEKEAFEQEKISALKQLGEAKEEERRQQMEHLTKEMCTLRVDRDRYKELDARSTKQMLDTVNPVLRWVRLRGPREHGALPSPDHDTTEYSARPTMGSPTSECPPLHYTQHRMGMCFHSWDAKNVPGSEIYKMWPADRIFVESETTSVLWNDIFHLVRSAMNESRNALIVAYGQTGTGKSSTMISDVKGTTSPDTTPILWRALDFIYDRHNGDFNVEVMVLQQYKSSITDLSVDPPGLNDQLALLELTRSHTDLTIESRLRYKLQQKKHLPIKFHSHDDMNAAKTHVHELLQRRKRDATPQNECSSRSHTFIFLRIKHKETGSHRGLITLVDLAGQENRPIPSDDPGRKSKDKENTAIHNSIAQSLAKFKGFIKCNAAAESRAVGSEPPNKIDLHKFDHPLTDLLRLVVEVTPGRPLPSIVIIAHVSTVKRDAAESRKTLEWLHNCKSESSERKKKLQGASKDEVKQWEQLILDASWKARQWEAFAREVVGNEMCDEFAVSLGEMDGLDAEELP